MNRRMVPEFILRKSLNKEYSGRFSAWVIQIDLIDFSLLSTRLMQDSDKGAEQLSEIINAIFTPAIECIERYGGFISRFAGDAFIALFPDRDDKSGLRAITSACRIRDIVKQSSLVPMSSRIGLSHGVVNWQILPDPNKHLYWFSGACIQDAIVCQESAKADEIVLCKKVLIKKERQNLVLVESEQDRMVIGGVLKPALEARLSRCRLSQAAYVPEEIVARRDEGEFREVVSLFVNLRGSNIADLSSLIQLCVKYGAHLNKVFNSSHGLMALLLFGAPKSYEDNVLRAFRLVNDLRNTFGRKMKMGMSMGAVYAGFIGSMRRCEYSALGLSVNLAARLCIISKPGEICFEESLLNTSARFLSYKNLGARAIKGFEDPVNCYAFGSLIEDFDATYLSPFKGREAELAELSQCTTDVTAREKLSLCYIYGEPGTGKSRLLYEYAKAMRGKWQSYTLQCDGILKTALHPFIFFIKKQFNGLKSGSIEQRRQNFQRRFAVLRDSIQEHLSAEQLAGFDQMESILAGLIALDWDDSAFRKLSANGKAKALQDTIIKLFEYYALASPTILIVEDIQWLDDESRQILETLITSLKGSRLLVLCSARYNDDRSSPCLDLKLPSRTVHLQSWDLLQVKTFASSLLKHAVSESLASYLKEQTNGNLLYIEQICAHLEANGLLESIDGLLYVKDTGLQLSSGINSMLMARIDRLDNCMKEALQAASVLGNEFTAEVLQELLVRSQAFSSELTNPGEILENGRKIRLWDMLNEVSYSFSHGLLRDTAYDMQLSKHLKKLHLLAAEIMVEYWQGDRSKYSEIAAHFEKAQSYERASDYYYQAGEWSKELFQQQASLECLNKALDIARTYLPKQDRKEADILMGIGVLQLNFGKYDLALGYLKQAEKLYLKVCGEGSLALSSCLGNMGSVYKSMGDYDKSIEYTERTLAIILKHKGENYHYVATCYSNIAGCYLSKADFEKSLEYYKRALELRESIFGPHHFEVADTLMNLACLHYDMENYPESKACIDRTMVIYSRISEPHFVSRAQMYNNAGRIYAGLGENEKALEFYEEALRLGTIGLGARHSETVVSKYNIANAYSKAGKPQRALDLLAEVEDAWQESLGEKHPWVALCRNSIGKNHIDMGNAELGLKQCSEALQVIQENLGTEHPWCEIIAENIAYAKQELGTS